jgi:hypothetical protein
MYIVINVKILKGPAVLRYRSQKQFWLSEELLIKGPEIGTDKKNGKSGLYWYIASCSVGNAHRLDTNFVIILKFVKDVSFHLFKNY